MHAARSIGAMIVVKRPPLAGVAAIGDRRKAAEPGLIPTRSDCLDDLNRKQLFTVQTALVEHHLAQPAQIAQTGRDAAPGKGHTFAVDGLIGVLLSPDPLPE